MLKLRDLHRLRRLATLWHEHRTATTPCRCRQSRTLDALRDERWAADLRQDRAKVSRVDFWHRFQGTDSCTLTLACSEHCQVPWHLPADLATWGAPAPASEPARVLAEARESLGAALEATGATLTECSERMRALWQPYLRDEYHYLEQLRARLADAWRVVEHLETYDATVEVLEVLAGRTTIDALLAQDADADNPA